MSIINDKYTLTTIFLLPIICNNKKIEDIENCYIASTNNINNNNELHIIYKGKNLIDIILVDQEYIQDYDLFLTGKYSKISLLSKNKIIEYWKKYSEDDAEILHGILFKTNIEKLKKLFRLEIDKFSEISEFFPTPNLLNEIY